MLDKSKNAALLFGYYDNVSQVTHSFNPANKCVFIFVITGSLTIEGTQIAQREAIGIWDTGSITIDCTSDTEFLIIETPVNQK